MRYQDWDVLLFPSGDDGAHVPVKEFKTTCYAEPHDNALGLTPLLTTFIPSLPQNAPFQISVHSWTKTGPVVTPGSDGSRLREIWQVKVVIDGKEVCIENFAIDASWPQIICELHNEISRCTARLIVPASTAQPGTGRDASQLKFPPFHHTLMSERYWNAADKMGRIRVELSISYADERHDRFVKMYNVVNFSFQPAPLGELKLYPLSHPMVDH